MHRIDHLDRWCPDLKILYLQSNLISKLGERAIYLIVFKKELIPEHLDLS